MHGSAPEPADLGEFFAGKRLYGDDFSREELLQWFQDERSAYFEMEASDRTRYAYHYHALNRRLGFAHLPAGRFEQVLSFGGAFGDELEPVVGRIGRIVIVEPAQYENQALQGVPIEYRVPDPMGTLPVADAEFDLVTAFGALHHIANVSTVLREFARCLKPGGYALIREPTVTMGDWRQKRLNQTPRERGIPLRVFDEIVVRAGFTVAKRQRCVFPLTPRIGRALKVAWFNSPTLVALDRLLSGAFAWRDTYHPTHWLQKVQPSSVFYVLRKP